MLGRVLVDDSGHFRDRAKWCRRLANDARDEVSRRELTDIAVELDAEADRIETESGTKPKDD